MKDEDYLERFMDSVQYVSRMMKRNVRDQALPHGITKTQWFILRILWKRPCTIGELAEKLEVRSSSMSQMIDRMEVSGLVQRQTDPLDGRSKMVVLNEKGEEHIKAVSRSGIELLSVPFSQFTSEEKMVIVELMEKFKLNLSANFDQCKDK
ncbi:MarR family winged helix-turn-helix transcriptional regulator [Lederbergia citrea]|uniref:MarR family winged helix-turn-helix transcriptional regulator n=1 Tax=Lederbergia citrea TaxID=2833581 RepID=UPI001BC971DF|nr:MarR family transcriptional regulator [Lederbergia citrea]MBS4177820.1 MarR family transcriptional regulator [Lederbergia citrea]